ncbi:MAG: 16S rRNA (cytosine(967)-C(5))-methyltransferase RsmB [Eubacteriales bacterium]|nr:16S rRNA (cytosine(967)-C(5))-methyltransferase RsmB [Eubacteriales bacterium]
MSVRRRALEALTDVTDRGAYANLRLKSAQQGLSLQDAAFVSALVYETLDHLLYIDHVLSAFIKGSQKPVIRGILRMGVCQLLYMHVPISAAVNESVKLAKEVGKNALSGYVNGVLRHVAQEKDALPPLPSDPVQRMSIQYSWPIWLVQEWTARFGTAETERLLACPPAKTALRPQPPYTVEQLSKLLTQMQIGFMPGKLAHDCLLLDSGFDIVNQPQFNEGCYTVQSESAMLVCRACGVEPGMRILDACAAPGGKSAYLYALAGGDCKLFSWELYPHRAELMQNTFSRLHVQADISVQDAAEPRPDAIAQYDVVLIDAPCSGLGVAGSKPDVRYAKSSEGIFELAKLQERILNTCAAYVKPGGVLVYATCTISTTENEEQITRFLAMHAEYALETLVPYLPEAIPGLQSGMVQLLPQRDGVEGFFMARLRKTR